MSTATTAQAAEMRRATWTADGVRLEIWTDGRTYQRGFAVNAVRVPAHALSFLAQVIGLFDLGEVDALIRRVAAAARKLGPTATHAELAAPHGAGRPEGAREAVPRPGAADARIAAPPR